MKRKNPLAPHTLLVLGAAIMVAGGVLLIWNLGFLPQLGKLYPLPFMLAGLFLLYLVYFRGKRPRYIVPGMVLSLGGLFFLLLNSVLPIQDMTRIWPAFMLITGLSLVPYGIRKKAAARAAIIIPAVFISALSLLFFPFSLGTAGISFLEFVQQWWPLILIVVGIALIVSFFSTRRPNR
jgi:hypothetical protein